MILVSLYIAYIVLFPVWLSIRLHKGTTPPRELSAGATRLLALAILSVLVLSNLASMLPYYLWPDSIIGESESGVVAVAALASHGFPFYSGSGGLGAHALLYGPLTYAIYEAVFLAGGSFLAVKLVAAIAGLVAVFVIARELQKLTDRASRALAALTLGSFLLPHLSYLVIPKGDVWVLLFASIPLLTRDRAFHGWVLGACAGLAMSAKVPAVAAFLPYLVDAVQRQGFKRTSPAFLTGALALAACHVPLGEGLRDYLALLSLASRHPIAPQLAGATVLSLVLPGVVYVALLRQTRATLVDASLILVAAILLIPAGKVGAGSYHLAVVMPPLAMRMVELMKTVPAIPKLRRSDALFALLLTALFITTQIEVIPGIVKRARTSAAQLVDARPVFEKLAGQRFAIAPSHDGFANLEPYLQVPAILAGAEAPVTVAGLSDWWLAKEQLPERVRADLLDCRRTWLSAAEVAEPWGAVSTYWTLPNLDVRGEGVVAGSFFDAAFRERFRAVYTEKRRMGPYIAWTCRAG